jgi:uncharacterized protein YbjT (DUF2867 family)
MKVLIIGGTGGTGKLIVQDARDHGYEVVALVRSQEKGATLGSVQLAIGDATDEATLTTALQGCDAVISALGTPMSPFREVTLLSAATFALIRASDLDWIIIRPSVLNDKPATGRVRALTDLSNFHGGSISRADVAQFTVKQLTEDRYLKQTPLITES